MLHQYLHIGQVSRRVARRQDEALITVLQGECPLALQARVMSRVTSICLNCMT